MFSKKLRELMNRAGVDCAELARRTGWPYSTVYALLRLKPDGSPKWSTLQMVALALGVSTEEFRDVEELPPYRNSRPVGRPKKGR